MFKQTVLVAAIIGLATTGGAMAQSTAPASIADTAKGKALVDSKGMTLYSFDKDSGGKSACNGPCATNWPPLAATSGTAMGDWSMITRDDGSKQWAYKGKPLYVFAKDAKSGDTKGDGVLNGAWHIAAP
jgi:predicted lipoprotein with Yx(FWY)xxD motif